MLQSLGEAFRIDDLRELKLENVEANFRWDDGVMHVDPLILTGKDIQLRATGDIRIASGTMKLQARLTVNETIEKQLPKFVRQSFQSLPDTADGSVYLDFNIGGSLDHPKSDLLDRILSLQGARSTRPLETLIQSLFSPDRRSEKKKLVGTQRTDKSATSESPSASGSGKR